jgi:hypothetical protein
VDFRLATAEDGDRKLLLSHAMYENADLLPLDKVMANRYNQISLKISGGLWELRVTLPEGGWPQSAGATRLKQARGRKEGTNAPVHL